jgi:8-oxo-dGTP pyrophosphatase MutT (NUDIX family)
MNKNNFCNNCGKIGHLFHQCKLPITSYGIILFRYFENKIQFLMIRRKDSFGYIDFIRGKYSINNLDHIQSIINEMSIYEKKKILTENFETLWKNMWGDTYNSQYKNEETLSSKKFETLKTGIVIDNNLHTLDIIVQLSNTEWNETEWEFPKGRRNFQERDIDCAIREFTEETGLSEKNIHVLENVLPFEEIFIGTNFKSYKHKYFLTYLDYNDIDNINNNLFNFQKTEVSKIEWKSYEECLESIRPYNLEKKKLITNIYKLLKEYRLYS